MKNKAIAIMKYYIDGYYDTKYDPGSSAKDKAVDRESMCAVADALTEVGLLTREEIRTMRHEAHERKVG